MSVRYGFNITASDMRKMLEENERQQNGVRSWKQLFGNAALGYNAQSDVLKTDYSSVIADAYAANFKRQNAILGAGYNAGATSAFLADNRNDLLSAYDTYVKNYQQNASALAENYAKETDVYDKALDERSQNFAKLYNLAYDYLSQELNGAYQTFGEGEDQTTVDYMTNQGLTWMQDENGVLRSWNDLSYELFDDTTGELTDKGRDFYNRVFNDIPQSWIRDVDDTKSDVTQRAMRGFDEWLSDTDADLRNWWVSQDEFNVGGSNKNSAEKYIGIDGMQTPDLSVKNNESGIPAETPAETQWQRGTYTPWHIANLGTGRTGDKQDDFTLVLDVSPNKQYGYDLTTKNDVSETLSKELNRFATGGENTSPSTEGEGALNVFADINSNNKWNKLVVYKGNMYLYTKNGWRSVHGRYETSMPTVIDAFLRKT